MSTVSGFRLALVAVAFAISGAPAQAQEAEPSAFRVAGTHYDHCLFYVGRALFAAGRALENSTAGAVETCEPERAAAAQAYMDSARARGVAGDLEVEANIVILGIQGRALLQLEDAILTQQPPTASK